MSTVDPTERRSDGGPAVLAFGGNALLPDPFHPEEQDRRAAELARVVLQLLPRSPGIVLVHGNGPQVGMILLRVEETRDRLPGESLDVLVAETQGSIGYLLSRALRNAMRVQGARVDVTSILTQVLVDPDDPAFAKPTKPVGPFYASRTAEYLRSQRGWHLVEEEGRGWRRVVASPRPREVVELEAIAAAARTHGVVIAGGGGGIPVVERDGVLEGVDAVVDKDRTAGLLAVLLDASAFLVLTGEPHVSRAYGTPGEEALHRLTVAEADALRREGEFAAGSMAPKVESVAGFVRERGRAALITDVAHLAEALRGEEGTWIVPDEDARVPRMEGPSDPLSPPDP